MWIREGPTDIIIKMLTKEAAISISQEIREKF